MVAYCCIPTCKNSDKTMTKHTLPKDRQMRQIWCKAIGRMDLFDIDTRKRFSYRICDTHFAEEHKFPAHHNRTNLKVTAVPTLNVPGKIDLQSIPTMIAENSPVTSNSDIIEFELSSESTSPSGEATAQVSFKSVLPGASTTNVVEFISERKRSDLIRRNPSKLMTKKSILMPQVQELYKLAHNLKKMASRLDYWNIKNKERLEKALRYAESAEFLKVKLNQRSLNFLLRQMKMRNEKANGKNYSFEEKVLALPLLKQGPRAYKLLENTFALPSRKSLVNLLNKISLTIGMNPALTTVLKNSVDRLEFLDMQCLMKFPKNRL